MKHLPVFLCIIQLLGCQVSKQPQPTLSDEQLSQTMADLYIAEAATTGMSGFSKDSLMKVYYQQVFEIHGITMEAYENDLKTASLDMNRLQNIVAEAQKILDGSAKKGK